jgi:hypothetical protein
MTCIIRQNKSWYIQIECNMLKMLSSTCQLFKDANCECYCEHEGQS